MIDQFSFPGIYNQDVRFYNFIGASRFQIWEKPRRASMVLFVCISGGAGGGGGASGTSGTPRGGGGGGSAATLTNLLINAAFLPDILYIMVAPGGQGGAADTIGLAGGISLVSVRLTTSVLSVDLLVGGTNSNPGGAGTSAALGAAGATVTARTAANMPWGQSGILNSFAGLAATTGGAIAGGAGGNATAAGGVLTGGTGGGGTTSADFAGGIVAGAGTALTSLAGGIAGGGNGQHGFNLQPAQYQFFSFGGTGGGSFNLGTGGIGGNGAIGAGGGGGGAGLIGGAGGDGGNGQIIITSW